MTRRGRDDGDQGLRWRGAGATPVAVAVLLLAATVPTPGPLMAAASPGQAPEPEPLALTDARVVDVRTGEVEAGLTVVLRDGRIVSVDTAEPPADARVIDLDGRYLLPGLMDAHVHVSDLEGARRALRSGVTTMRSASVGSYRDVALRELVRDGWLPGPDILAAGLFVTPQLGDAVLADPDLGEFLDTGVRGEEALRRLVRTNLRHGVDFVKTRGTERAGLPDTDPRQQVYTEAELRAVVQEAASEKIPVEAHAHGDGGARAAVLAGVRSIEHGTYLSDETLRLMRDRGTFLVPTYSTVVDLVEPGGDYDDPVLQVRGRHMLPRLRRTVQRAHALGVKIVTGADTGYGPSSVTRVSQEAAAFVEMGMTPLEALQSATTVAAELFGLEDRVGVIEPGHEADLVAVAANPLEDILALQDVLLVISNGRVGVERIPFAIESGAADR